MRLYDNAFPSNYDEIKTWYPVWYKDFFEMDALWRVWGGQLDKIQSAIERVIDNTSIDSADEPTIARLEAFFSIVYDSARTLTERKNVLQALILGASHVGRSEIFEIVSVFSHSEITVELVGGVVRVTVTHDFGDSFNLNDCRFVLERKIPAHLALDLIDNLLPVSAQNGERIVFKDFMAGFAAAVFAMAPAAFDMPELAFSGLSAATANCVTLWLLRDSLWTLNGEYGLNGERTLDANEYEEAL